MIRTQKSALTTRVSYAVHMRNTRRLAFESLEARRLLAVLTVTNLNDSGPGSLRAAIESANIDSALDTIQFALPGSGVRTIRLASELPGIFTPMVIDGWTQSGFAGKPLIQLQPDGQVGYGFSLYSNSSIIRGFVLNGFTNSHLAIWGGDFNKVQGNYFGTNSAGTALTGGNTQFDALFIGDGSVGNIIGVDSDGVTDAQERNIIGGGQSGVGLWGSNSTANRIAGNYIGTNAAQANLANQFAGVWLDAGANGNYIGSNNDGIGDALEGNIISRNLTHGVVINGSDTDRNRIWRNQIYDNALMEIDLGNNGPDALDDLDVDSGPNQNTNHPQLTMLQLSESTYVLGGTLTARPSGTYRIDVYSSSARDGSGLGGAQKFVGAFMAYTNSSGIATFSRTITGKVDYGWFVTATATDSSGNTSEFSPPIWDGVDLANTFALSSRPTATKTIYLDFNGHTTTGTLWNTTYFQSTIITPPFSLDVHSAFSNAELLRMRAIYEHVVEDFRPFDVNVTTIEPPLSDLIKEGPGDTRWGVRAAIGGSSADWVGSPTGGIGWNDSFNWNSDTPVFVFPVDNAQGAEDLTAQTISHEVGHALGLSHDGTSSSEYYYGHGTGATSWNSIMGGGSSARLTQWSKGQYLNASNSEDDLAIITTGNGFGFRSDDYGNSLIAAQALAIANVTTGRIVQTGEITSPSDRDFFYFETFGGVVDLNILPAPIGPNLDIYVRLYDANGTVLGASGPTDQLSARIARTVPAGRYYLSIDGIGKGTPLTIADGYTDYGSLGAYSISGTIAGLNQPPVLDGIGGTLNYTNNASPILIAPLATVIDVDSANLSGGTLTVAVTAGADLSNLISIASGVFTRSGRDVLFNGQPIGQVNSSAGKGTTPFVLTFNSLATPNVVQQLIRAFNFRTTNNGNPASRAITLTLTDGDGGTSNSLNVNIQVNL